MSVTSVRPVDNYRRHSVGNCKGLVNIGNTLYVHKGQLQRTSVESFGRYVTGVVTYELYIFLR